MTTRTTVRCLTVWTAVTAAALGVAALLLPAVPRHPAGTPFPDLVVGVAGLALVGCVAWAWLVTTVVVLERLAAVRSRSLAPRLVTPAWARRLVVLACGLALVGTAPAHAGDQVRGPVAGPTDLAGARAWHTHEETARRQRVYDRAHADHAAPPAPGGLPLDGLPLPDRPDGSGPAGRALGPAVGEVVVRRGDDLWSIAAATLAPRASTADVARATAALYAANRAVIGADPDLVVPGQHLRLPRRAADRREEHP